MLKQEKVKFMRKVFEGVAMAVKNGNPPYAALLVNAKGLVVAQAWNTQKSDKDATAHAEINVIRKACKKLAKTNLSGLILFSNTESCAMCMAASIKAGIKSFVFASGYDPKIMSADPNISGREVASRSLSKLKIETGILEAEALSQIEQAKRNAKK